MPTITAMSVSPCSLSFVVNVCLISSLYGVVRSRLWHYAAIYNPLHKLLQGSSQPCTTELLREVRHSRSNNLVLQRQWREGDLKSTGVYLVGIMTVHKLSSLKLRPLILTTPQDDAHNWQGGEGNEVQEVHWPLLPDYTPRFGVNHATKSGQCW